MAISPGNQHSIMEALSCAARASFFEAVKLLVPSFGLIQVAWQTFQATLRPDDLHGETREMLHRMREDYEQLLRPKLNAQTEEVVTIALRETFSILDEFGLSLEELINEAGLNPEQAARQTLKQAVKRLQLLDAPVQSLTERMVEDYYRVFLSHRDVVNSVSIPALQELLRRTENLTSKLLSALELHRWQEAWKALRPAVRTLSRPLSAENLLEALQAPYRLVEFVGQAHCALRDEISAALSDLASDHSRAWVLWGPGGAGKTRMAVEVALALGWQAFFIPASPLVAWASHLPIWSRPDRPTLLIVDYAEQRPADELQTVAQAIREAAPERAAPLALLLLMRPNPREAAAGHVTDALDEAKIRWHDWMVPSVDTNDRQAIFQQTRARFRTALVPPDAPPEVDYAPHELPATPLALIALAVLASHGHRVAQSQSEIDVLEALWNQWELPRWRRTLLAQGGEDLLKTPEVLREAQAHIELALAAATLGRRFLAPEMVANWWKEHFPFQKNTRLDLNWLAQRLHSLFPGVEETWQLPSISPDPLADLVLMQQLARHPKLVSVALSAPEHSEEEATRNARQCVEVLARLWVRVREEGERRQVEGWMQMVAQRLAVWPSSAWTSLAQALPAPDRTLALRSFLADFYQARLTHSLPEEERAKVLTMLGYALSELGRREKALAAAQEAVAIRRQLAQQHPEAFLPALAMSLNNLGNRLSELGRREEALAAAQEAVAHYRQLAQQHPEAFLPDLAMSLNNLGAMLSELGRREEALAAAQEAVAHYRQLAQQHPEAFLPDLAMSLNNLGAMLSELGRREEALAAAQEAVAHYRQLAQQHPEAFLPDLAMSLRTYGIVLRALSHDAEAVIAFADGLRAILPFVDVSSAFGELAKNLLQGYRSACTAAQVAPDTALLAQVIQALGQASS
jgi:tetratricopeptide (TPR) repeat protein